MFKTADLKRQGDKRGIGTAWGSGMGAYGRSVLSGVERGISFVCCAALPPGCMAGTVRVSEWSTEQQMLEERAQACSWERRTR